MGRAPQTTPAGDETWRRNLLLEAYRLERAEDTSHLALQAGFASLAFASIGLLAGLMLNVCSVGYAGRDQCVPAPDVLLAGAPLVPTALLAYLAANALRSTLRSFHMRALERELAGTVPDTSVESYPGLTFPRGAELTLFASPTALRRSGAARALGVLVMLALIVGYVGFLAVIIAAVSAPWRLIVVAVYGAAFLSIGRQGVLAVVDGRRYFYRAVHTLDASLGEDLQPRPARPPGTRSLTQYLLLPRPDSIPKAFLIVVAAALAAVVDGVSLGGTVWTVLLGVVVFELLLYQSRYQLNDIRGLEEDTSDPAAAERQRLPVRPGEARFAVRASLVVAAARIYAAVCLTLFLAPPGQVVMAVAAALLVILSAIYELLRARSGARLVGVVLALGYALRAGVGVALVEAARWPHPEIVAGDLVIVVVGAAFGSMFVAMTWTLHAVCQAGPVGADWDVPTGWRSDQARPHLAPLLQFVDLAHWEGARPADWKVVQALRPRTSLVAPWNLSVLVAAAGAGWLLVAWRHVDAITAVSAVVCLAIAVVLTQTTSRGALVGIVSALVLGGAIAASVLVDTVPAGAPLISAVPLLCILATYRVLAASSYFEVKSTGARAGAAAKQAWDRAFRAVIGGKTAATLEREGRPGP
ncbi:hypothetical protein [Cellulomonas sp. Root137]|uniref:hypothetical protein n=1 Tax=Cellulomonas sp. Root137 TaxID=1736459 RepID=UPI0007018E02|nr:hypothetical protein [Cellulomonas sp. Root137]KQY44362.1 hypothetical protein ASD18_12540 [Cellulomonas sp. Root137]